MKALIKMAIYTSLIVGLSCGVFVCWNAFSHHLKSDETSLFKELAAKLDHMMLQKED